MLDLTKAANVIDGILYDPLAWPMTTPISAGHRRTARKYSYAHRSIHSYRLAGIYVLSVQKSMMKRSRVTRLGSGEGNSARVLLRQP